METSGSVWKTILIEVPCSTGQWRFSGETRVMAPLELSTYGLQVGGFMTSSAEQGLGMMARNFVIS